MAFFGQKSRKQLKILVYVCDLLRIQTIIEVIFTLKNTSDKLIIKYTNFPKKRLFKIKFCIKFNTSLVTMTKINKNRWMTRRIDVLGM